MVNTKNSLILNYLAVLCSIFLIGLLIAQSLVSIGFSVTGSFLLVIIFTFIYFLIISVSYVLVKESSEYVILSPISFIIFDFIVWSSKTSQLRDLGYSAQRSAPPDYIYTLYGSILVLGLVIWLIIYFDENREELKQVQNENIGNKQNPVKEKRWNYLESKKRMEEENRLINSKE